MKVRFLSAAQAELDEAAAFYEGEESALGFRLLSEIEAAVSRITENPQAWPVAFDCVRRCRVFVFPFLLFFVVRDTEILILAVAHAKRKPGYWTKRL